VSSFLTAHQHIIGHFIPFLGEHGLTIYPSITFLYLFLPEENVWIHGIDIYRPYALPIIQPTVSKHTRKLKAPVTSDLALSFLHTLSDS